jgi:hypothetical protein
MLTSPDFRELLKIFEKHNFRKSKGKAPIESRYYDVDSRNRVRGGLEQS